MDPAQTDPPSESRRRFLVGSGAVGASVGMASVGAAAVAPAPAPRPDTITLRFTVNGKPRTLQIDPRTTLLDALREQLHLMGTKKGCDRGQCGACTVLVEGRRVNSCLTLAATLEYAHVTTIEGLAPAGQLHPVQQAFVEHDGLQCGYCTPGQIMSCVALIEETKGIKLGDDEIRERMSGNICRCGAYVGIVAAVRQVTRAGV
jgi:xanthine dehydrogenase YagT iron-sulfur-binding subunit